MNYLRIFLFGVILLVSSLSNGQEILKFQQKDKTQIQINPINNFEKLEITTSRNNKIQVIDSIETSITDKQTQIAIEDYNFDGYHDFACYHLDDGMGVYTIYQIFIYNPENGLFKKLRQSSKFAPECDEFCDIQINKKKKTLQSSCRGGARWHTDIWKFDKNKNLILLKK
ncbi:hypothetical protein OIU83_08885 [Flavobacterium sp. LS1R49]|uniref:Uncharacterized protein n=1 Tax=Flavobacterium shii TaxID=2987687 RepID=A0A9X3C4H5_9FLAO|nr:hypothetical protein [Flavobacterium shii]MCV9927764.1 hypothetical protein [Flavobacterium shii]